MIGRILFWWGAAVCTLFVLAALTSALVDVYVKEGFSGLIIAFTLLSALPALLIGLVWSDK